jgi:hypothetical protein
MTLHDLAMYSFGQYWNRSIRTGYAFAEISSIYAKTSDPLWSAESRGNIIRGAFWICTPFLALVLSLIVASAVPILLFLFAAAALFARTAIKARVKTLSPKFLLAYSLHSHLQQIPILLGQLRFRRRHRSGQSSAIIEYKTIP